MSWGDLFVIGVVVFLCAGCGYAFIGWQINFALGKAVPKPTILDLELIVADGEGKNYYSFHRCFNSRVVPRKGDVIVGLGPRMKVVSLELKEEVGLSESEAARALLRLKVDESKFDRLLAELAKANWQTSDSDITDRMDQQRRRYS
jgi:hypothetical protein